MTCCNSIELKPLNEIKGHAENGQLTYQDIETGGKKEGLCLQCYHCAGSAENTKLDLSTLDNPSGSTIVSESPRLNIKEVAQADSLLRSVVLTLVLSFDSILEGVTTGLKTTN